MKHNPLGRRLLEEYALKRTKELTKARDVYPVYGLETKCHVTKGL